MGAVYGCRHAGKIRPAKFGQRAVIQHPADIGKIGNILYQILMFRIRDDKTVDQTALRNPCLQRCGSLCIAHIECRNQCFMRCLNIVIDGFGKELSVPVIDLQIFVRPHKYRCRAHLRLCGFKYALIRVPGNRCGHCPGGIRLIYMRVRLYLTRDDPGRFLFAGRAEPLLYAVRAF